MSVPGPTSLLPVLKPLVARWREQRATLLQKRGDIPLPPARIRDLFRGLRGVPAVVCDTSHVDPEAGLYIRGTPVNELLEESGEALWFLLLTGRRPSVAQEQALREDLEARAVVPEATNALIDQLAGTLHPMSVLSAATLSLQAGSAAQQAYDNQVPREALWEHDLEDALRLAATVPIIAARIYRKGIRGLEPIEPPSGVGFSDGFAMGLGLDRDPTEFVGFLRQFIVVHADHEGANASVLAARVTHSTRSDLFYALSTAMNTLAGPLHGRSNQASLQLVLDIQQRFGGVPTRDQLQQHVAGLLDEGVVVPGFGHAVLRGRDPRYDALVALGRRLCAECGTFAIAEAMEEVVIQELRARGKAASPYPNIDGISGALLHYFGMTEVTFYTVMFSVSQLLGLTAQLVLERAFGAPILRPRSVTTASLAELATDA